ncbi:MAG TPA: 50S ribosomal protein L6 [Exilispira sp.]|nr:50S ribosomal protein L6 [Exilispira sp.]
MSRLAKKPLAVPSNVKFSYTQEGNFYKFDVKGPKGNITKLIRNDVEIKQGKDGLIFTLKGNDNAKKPMIGTTYRIVNSMIEGVVNGFSKTLVLYGVGFKASIKG